MTLEDIIEKMINIEIKDEDEYDVENKNKKKKLISKKNLANLNRKNGTKQQVRAELD